MKERPIEDPGQTSLSFQGARLPGRSVSMPMLVDALQTVVLDRPVIDETGLRGRYDFDLSWMPDPEQFDGRGGGVPFDSNAPSIFTAVQEQLGLRLESRKEPVEMLVVDGAGKPGSN